MNPRQPQISVIMAAHNVGRLIRRAVESLQNQTLRDFELLVVDDGSTDRTAQIIDAMAERDYRIIVFHNEQAGISEARNYALARARGTYVCFMDADDWVEPGMLADMLELAKRSSLELVIAGYYIDTYAGDDGEHVTEARSLPDAIYPTQHEFRAAAWQMFDQGLINVAWNKLYQRERIDRLGIRFASDALDDYDYTFALDYIRDVERAGVLEHPYYHYVCDTSRGETAPWREDLYETREDEHSCMLDLYRHWGLEGDAACMEMLQRRYVERLIGCIENVCSPQCDLSKREKIAQIGEMITSDRAQLAVATVRPRSRAMRAIIGPIKARNARLAYREGRLMLFVKRHSSRAYSSLRDSR